MRPNCKEVFSLRRSYQRSFPSAIRDGLFAQSLLGRYPRKIVPFEFVYVFPEAFLRHLAERSGKRIGEEM